MFIERYEEMQKEALDEQLKLAQIETLTKFAGAAEALLQEKGEEYTADDVIKVASFLIDAQLDLEEQEEKTASYQEIGREMAIGFLNALGEQE